MTGHYLWRSSKLHSEANAVSLEVIYCSVHRSISSFSHISKNLLYALQEANKFLSNQFSSLYLALEIALKLSATVYLVFITSMRGREFLFAIYSLVANLASIGMIALMEIDGDVGEVNVNIDILNVLMVARLVYKDRFILFLLPFQFSFGFASSFIPFYLFGTIVNSSQALGRDTSIGFFSTLIVLSGAGTASLVIWSRYLDFKVTKTVLMGTSGIFLALSGFLLLISSEIEMESPLYLMCFLIVYGAGRGIWEVSNRRVIADYFENSPENASAGFALVAFCNGLSAALGYFSILVFSKNTIATTIIAAAFMAILCYSIGVVFFEQSVDGVPKKKGLCWGCCWKQQV